MIIAVDFDGTIVEHRYPRIGEEIPFAVDTLKLLQQEKHRLIGEFCFSSKMTDIQIENGKVSAITVNDTEKVKTDCLVLAIGHSARDTFTLLKDKNLPMEAKAFAVGPDNGSEFADHQYIAKELGIDFYFAKPHHTR